MQKEPHESEGNGFVVLFSRDGEGNRLTIVSYRTVCCCGKGEDANLVVSWTSPKPLRHDCYNIYIYMYI